MTASTMREAAQIVTRLPSGYFTEEQAEAVRIAAAALRVLADIAVRADMRFVNHGDRDRVKAAINNERQAVLALISGAGDEAGR